MKCDHCDHDDDGIDLYSIRAIGPTCGFEKSIPLCLGCLESVADVIGAELSAVQSQGFAPPVVAPRTVETTQEQE